MRSSIDEIKFDWQNSKLDIENIPLVNLGEIKVTTDPTTGQGLAQVSSAYKENGSKTRMVLQGHLRQLISICPFTLPGIPVFAER